MSARWDIVCRVVDNFGDTGVCWRLARQLFAEHGLDVTLHVDRIETLACIEPSLDVHCASQSVAGVVVRTLDEEAAARALPDVVIEAFGCGLPARYVAAMAAAAVKPLWINLEYLSAEPWVDQAHALASPNPQLPLTRWFWFPGFTRRTGGLLRERGLFARRDAWQAEHRQRDRLRVLLFSYENAALPALLRHWARSGEDVVCVVPEGVAGASLDRFLGASPRAAGERIVRGRLAIDVMPFTDQDGFDRRLWSADVNFVRGEDSFVRAQWAAKPFVWQPYRQSEGAHAAKLDAFLARYEAHLPSPAAQANDAFWRAWNDEDAAAIADAWDVFRDELAPLARCGRDWAERLAKGPELAASLVDFSRRRL